VYVFGILFDVLLDGRFSSLTTRSDVYVNKSSTRNGLASSPCREYLVLLRFVLAIGYRQGNVDGVSEFSVYSAIDDR
jgi:hypothetical protein